MPLFEYQCTKCHKLFESYKRPSEDAAVETCPSCKSPAAKVQISLVGSAGSGGASASSAKSCGTGRSPFS